MTFVYLQESFFTNFFVMLKMKTLSGFHYFENRLLSVCSCSNQHTPKQRQRLKPHCHGELRQINMWRLCSEHVRGPAADGVWRQRRTQTDWFGLFYFVTLVFG